MEILSKLQRLNLELQNLDEENTKAIVDLLFELKDEQETTLFLVTHSRELAKKCDRIIKIRDGKLQ